MSYRLNICQLIVRAIKSAGNYTIEAHAADESLLVLQCRLPAKFRNLCWVQVTPPTFRSNCSGPVVQPLALGPGGSAKLERVFLGACLLRLHATAASCECPHLGARAAWRFHDRRACNGGCRGACSRTWLCPSGPAGLNDSVQRKDDRFFDVVHVLWPEHVKELRKLESW